MSTSHDHTRLDSPSGLSMSDFELASRAAPDWTEDETPPPEPVDPALLARRRQLRSWVGRGMLALAAVTLAGVLARGIQQRLAVPEASPLAATVIPAASVVTSIDPAPASDADLPVPTTSNVVAPASAKAAKRALAAGAAPKVSKSSSNPKKRAASHQPR